MRRLLAICLLSLLGACETQGLGQRCEESANCGAGATCVLYNSPSQPCTGQNCVCCPTDSAQAAMVTGCMPGNATVDAGFPDVVDTEASASETGVEAGGMDVQGSTDAGSQDAGGRRALGQSCTASADCDVDLFCDANVCRLQRGIGQNCADGTNCQSTFCVTGVCCNAVCTGAGFTCNDPASPGVCTAPTVTDSGTPDTGAGQNDASSGG